LLFTQSCDFSISYDFKYFLIFFYSVARKIALTMMIYLFLCRERLMDIPILLLLLIYFKGQAVRLRRTWSGHGI